jgi:hypothetical protein
LPSAAVQLSGPFGHRQRFKPPHGQETFGPATEAQDATGESGVIDRTGQQGFPALKSHLLDGCPGDHPVQTASPECQRHRRKDQPDAKASGPLQTRHPHEADSGHHQLVGQNAANPAAQKLPRLWMPDWNQHKSANKIENRLDEINNYCRCDVLDTYFDQSLLEVIEHKPIQLPSIQIIKNIPTVTNRFQN